MRELFIEELVEVKGGQGGPVEELLERFALSLVLLEDTYSTMACGEEGPC